MTPTEVAIQQQAIGRANGTPMPGPMASAFNTAPTEVAGYVVRQVVASDWPRLSEIKSPLADMVMEASQNPQKPSLSAPTDQQVWEVCWMFTHTPQECRSAISGGLEAFSARCSDEIGDRWQQPLVRLVYATVLAKVTESWSTALKYAAELEAKGEVTFFRDLPANPRTG